MSEKSVWWRGRFHGRAVSLQSTGAGGGAFGSVTPVVVLCALAVAGVPGSAAAESEPAPILFVTQVPIPADFATIGSVFGNHLPTLASVGRGGDLWVWYPDGELNNLTAAAGYGNDGFQGRRAIAVRDPSVHWNGSKALFSMVVGAPVEQYEWETYFWQIYEVSGLGQGEVAEIRRVAYQPNDANNVSPIYGTDGRVVFTSDRARTGEAHLYPQLDEYEEAPSVSGLWSLDPSTGDLNLLVHSPSGAFTPTIDSFGRLIFTQWDHLQRDQQADTDAVGGETYGTFNWSDESVASVRRQERTELFPEPRPSRIDLLSDTNLVGHTFNHFFPWMAREDGTEVETLVHIGRHELHSYFDRSLTDDPNLIEFTGDGAFRKNASPVANLLQLKEDPRDAGVYYGVDAPEFETHAAGQIVRIEAPPDMNPDDLTVTYITHPATADYTATPDAEHSGLYREPLPLASGELVAVHTVATEGDDNLGSRSEPRSRYDFRLKRMDVRGRYAVAGTPLTGGIHKAVTYYDPDELVSYSGPLWELNPVEVRARPVPHAEPARLPPPEEAAFIRAGVSVPAFREWLRERGLAVVVSRNVTSRDNADRQQPFNLEVPGTSTRTVGTTGKVYEATHLQIFQADQLRGIFAPRPGRRVLAQPLHDPAAKNPRNAAGPSGSVAVAADGSTAAMVPARRALTWQLTDSAGVPTVRERYWLSFQPGEIRSCPSCHGVNTVDQAGQAAPTNVPEALVTLLGHWTALIED